MDRLDALTGMAARGSAEAREQLCNELVTAFRVVAETSPTAGTIEGQRDVFSSYGPQDPIFSEVLDEAFEYFNTGQVREAVDDIADTYRNEGSLAAAETLSQYTAYGNADPLTASRILDAAQPTVGQIIRDLNPWDALEIPGIEPALDNYYRQVIFSHLSAAADNASRSNQAAASIGSMARQINEQGFDLVTNSISAGNGITLPLEMLKQTSDPMTAANLAYEIRQGIDDLKERVRESVGDFADAALPVTEPGRLWSGMVEDPGAAFLTVMDTVREDGTTLRQELAGHIARISDEGYQVMRVIDAMEDYAPHLESHSALNEYTPELVTELLEAGAMPPANSDPALEFALGTTPALIDAVREQNLEGFQDRSVLDPYSTIPDPSWFLRMPRNSLRNAYSGWEQIRNLMNGGSGGPTRITTGTPLGVGMSLYGVLTYGLGVRNQSATWANNADREGWIAAGGWRTITADALYVTGFGIETTQVIAGLLGQRMSLVGLSSQAIQELPVWQRGIASIANDSSGLLRTINTAHLRTFGVFNLLGAIDEASQGDPIHAWAYGIAGTSTLASTMAPQIAAQAARAGLWSGMSGPFLLPASATVSNVIGWIATGVIFGKNLYDQAQRAAHTEPFQAAYLEAAGIRPEIARELANNDGDGLSAAPRLEALANYAGIEPDELLSWLNEQDPEFVRDFVRFALHPLKPDDNGDFVERVGEENFDSSSMVYEGEVRVYPAPHPEAIPPTDPEVWNGASIAEAQSLEGILIWAEASGNPLMQ
ncbi:MAG: hypothetical protein HC850_02650 [Rhodomicrobium sp.]|nr:hypothetical protein [Rhodomicrobium sp.]